MSLPSVEKQLFSETNIINFLSEINLALSSIDLIENDELSSLSNNTFHDEKFHKINSNVYLVSNISKNEESEMDGHESTTSFLTLQFKHKQCKC